MARYKLIKNYPACNLEIGSYIEFPGNCQQIINSNGNFLKSDLEKFTEFWEKLEEKEYEIIKETYNILIGKWEIRSVKRLSDGKIFSVGDKIDFRDGEVRKITGISLDDTGVSEFSKRDIPWLECGKDYGTCLDWAVHYKEPILITEDGVEIFKDDTYWRLIAAIKEDRTLTFLEKSDEKGAFPYRGGGGKFFSTKEAAEKYLNKNKPMYSKKEVIDFGGYILRNLKGVMPMKLLFELWLREKDN